MSNLDFIACCAKPKLFIHGTEDDVAPLAPLEEFLSTLPAGHGQGYNDCFDLFVADAYAAMRTSTAPDGLPLIADGVRAARIADAVLASARTHSWTEVTEVTT